MKGDSRFKAVSLVALPANATVVPEPLELVSIVPPEMPVVSSFGITLFASYDAYAPLIRLQDDLQAKGRTFIDVEAWVHVADWVKQDWVSEEDFASLCVLKAPRLKVEDAERLEAEYRAFLRRNKKRAEPKPDGLPHTLHQWVWQPQFFPEFIASHPSFKNVSAVYYEVVSDRSAVVTSEGRPFVKLTTLLTVIDPDIKIDARTPLLPSNIKVKPVFGESALKNFSPGGLKSA